MAATSLEFLILAKDQASEAFDKVASAVERQHSALDKLKAAGTIASAALVAGVAKFGSDSVEAYAEAEKKQTLLQEAFKKFPGLADTSIGKLNELNDAIQRKTGYDNDDLAASQATLAQYGLTGDQVAKLTPLVADYAAKTGKDLPTAAEAVGKAMLGQGRALKDVGVKFTDTHSAAGNFQELMSGLGAKVGGVAEAMGGTASGKVKILQKSFEDIQEKIGSMLIPVLTTLVGAGQAVMDWMRKNPAIVTTLAVVIGVLTVAIIAMTIAMWVMAAAEAAVLWPVLLIVVAIAALIAVVVLLATHWKQVTTFITGVWNGFVGWLTGVINGLVHWWNKSWNDFALGVSQAWNSGIIGPIRTAWEWIQNTLRVGSKIIGDVWNGLWGGLAGIVKGAFNGVIGWIESGVNNAIGLINGMIGAVNSVGGAVGIHLGTIPNVHIPRLATGGTITHGGMAIVGERGPELVSLPTGSTVHPNGGGRWSQEDMQDLAQMIGDVVMSGIMLGSQKTVRAAFGR